MSNSQNSQMNKGFLSHLMTHLLEGSQIPKVQVERSIGPVLGFFLAEVLTATLKDDGALSGCYRMLCPEFPLAKGKNQSIKENNQSTNIDFLLYNEDRQALVFLELKTAVSSFLPAQAVTYLENKFKVQAQSAAYLVSDLERIKISSSEPQKYAAVQQMLETRFPGGMGAMAQCRELYVIYLVPAQLKERDGHLLKRVDKALSFGELAMDIDGPFAEEWATIGQTLQQLDNNVKPNPSSTISDSGHLNNYQDRVDFDGIKALCSERGAQIVVGFAGGEAALRQSDLKQLRQRAFKWDVAEGGQGNKQALNWVAGNRFIDIVLSLEAACAGLSEPSAPARIAAQIPKEDLEVGAWYSGKGRNGDVGLWDGEDFLVLGLEGKKVGPDRSDWENEYRIKREPYCTVDDGCFQPFAKLAPVHRAA